MKLKKKTRLNCLIVILTAILFTTLFLGLRDQKILLAQNLDNYNNLSNENQDNISRSAVQYTDFYQKIKDDKDVNILLLGDEITLGTTSTDDIYPIDQNINSLLKSNYNIDSTFQFLEETNANTLKGYDLIDKNPDVNNYDLVILSFGLNDSKEDIPIDQFSQNYSDLVGRIKNQNYKCSIIALLPPSLSSDNQYISAIESVCILNNADYLDITKSFNESNTQPDELINGDLPTLSGYDIILSGIDNIIQTKLK